MKRQLGILCLLCLTVLGCASDKKVAPKEGRIPLQQEIIIDKADGKIKLDKGVNPTMVSGILYNAQNKRPAFKKINPTQDWEKDGASEQGKNGILLPTPVTGKSNVYTLDNEFTVRAHRRSDGELLWDKKLGNKDDNGISLIKSDNGLIALSQKGQIFALDFKGKVLWQKDLDSPFRNNPTLYKGKLYLLSANNDVWALNDANGKEIWHYKTEAPITFLQQMGTPAVLANTLIVPFSSGLVMAFDKDTGAYLWEQDMTGAKAFDRISNISQMTASPVIDGKTVFLFGHANRSGAFDLKDGSKIWTITHGGQLTPVINGNAIFVLTSDNVLMALNKNNGHLFWQQKIPEIKGKKALFIQDKAIWVIGEEKIISLDITKGQIIQEIKSEITGSRPILTGDGWYYLTQNGQLIHQGQL